MLFFVILNESALIFFVVFSKTQTPNPTDLQTTFLEPWNDKATKRRTTKRTPPNGKTFLRPSGMSASALNYVKELDTFWWPFGSLLAAFWLPLARFWLPLSFLFPPTSQNKIVYETRVSYINFSIGLVRRP